MLSKEERRQSLLESAKAVFSEKGYHLAKVEDIVERAGVARGTFYLYFENKRATFAELLDDLIARLRVAILRIDPTGPIYGQVLRNVERAVAILLEDPQVGRLLLTHATGADPEFDQKIADFYDAIARMLEDALALGQRMEIVRPCDARLTAWALLGAVKEVFHRVVIDGYRPTRGSFAEALLAQSLYGLLVREGSPAADAAGGVARAAATRAGGGGPAEGSEAGAARDLAHAAPLASEGGAR